MNCELLLVNTTHFEATLPDEYTDWKNENLNPIYAQAPLKRMAYVLKQASYEYFKGVVSEEGTYTNRYFNNEEKAIEWLIN